MSIENNISFDTDNTRFKSRTILGSPQTPGMTKFLINKGLVKDEKQANSLMIIITILFLLAAVYVFAKYVFEVNLFNKQPELTQEQIQRREEITERLEQLRQQRSNNTNTQNETQTQ